MTRYFVNGVNSAAQSLSKKHKVAEWLSAQRRKGEPFFSVAIGKVDSGPTKEWGALTKL